jgi:hypothetical protein
LSRDAGYFIDGSQEQVSICLRRFVKTADFSHELERGSPNFFGSYWRIEIEEDLMFLHIDYQFKDIRNT